MKEIKIFLDQRRRRKERADAPRGQSSRRKDDEGRPSFRDSLPTPNFKAPNTPLSRVGWDSDEPAGIRSKWDLPTPTDGRRRDDDRSLRSIYRFEIKLQSKF